MHPLDPDPPAAQPPEFGDGAAPAAVGRAGAWAVSKGSTNAPSTST